MNIETLVFPKDIPAFEKLCKKAAAIYVVVQGGLTVEVTRSALMDTIGLNKPYSLMYETVGGELENEYLLKIVSVHAPATGTTIS